MLPRRRHVLLRRRRSIARLLASGSIITLNDDSIGKGPTTACLLELTGHNLFIPYGADQSVPGTDVIVTADCYYPTQTDRVLAYPYTPHGRMVGAPENEVSKGTDAAVFDPGYDSLFAAQGAQGELILSRLKIPGWGENNSTKIANAAANRSFLLAKEGPNFVNLGKSGFLYDNNDPNLHIATDGSNNHPSSNRGAFVLAADYYADLAPHLVTSAWIIPGGGVADPYNINPAPDHAGSAAASGTNQTGTVGANEITSASTLTSISVVWAKSTTRSGNAGVSFTVSGTPSADQYASLGISFPNTTIFPTENGQQIYYDTLVEVEHYAADAVSDPAGLYSVVINASAHPGSALLGNWDRASDAQKAINMPAKTRLMRCNMAVLAAPMIAPTFYVDFLFQGSRAADCVGKVGLFDIKRNEQEPLNKVITLDRVEGGIEGSGRVITVTARRGQPRGTATVTYTVTGTAADWAGGVLPTAILTFADGNLTTSANITLSSTASGAADRLFTTTLSNPTGEFYTLGATSSRTAVIYNAAGAPADADVLAYFYRFDVVPGTTFKNAVVTAIAAMKSGATSGVNIFATRDVIRFLRAPSKRIARLDASPNKHDYFEVGTGCAWTANSGVGYGGAGNYWSSAYQPAIARQNDYSVMINSIIAGVGTSAWWLIGGNTYLIPRFTGDGVHGGINQSIQQTQGTGTITTGVGSFAYNRSASGTYLTYVNGASIGSTSRTSTSPVYSRESLFLNDPGVSGAAAAFATAGNNLSAAAQLDLHNLAAAFAAY